jgi:hypothetical protein
MKAQCGARETSSCYVERSFLCLKKGEREGIRNCSGAFDLLVERWKGPNFANLDDVDV